MNFKQLSALAKKQKVKLDGVIYFIYLIEKYAHSGIPVHFVALIKGNAENYYFDSFAIPPVDQIINVLSRY